MTGVLFVALVVVTFLLLAAVVIILDLYLHGRPCREPACLLRRGHVSPHSDLEDESWWRAGARGRE